ncbi:MAG: SDR family oxidoreductase [Bacteroidota bacterium]
MKVALVTGANKGIGFETARQLAEQGMTVLMGSRDISKGENAAALLREIGLDVHPVKLDVTNNEDILALRKLIAEKYGKLDILVNNAGMIQGETFAENSTTTISQHNLQATFNTNFFSIVNITQQLLPLIEKSDAGRIVNLSSILGSLTLHADTSSPTYTSKSFAYNASKTALNQFTIHLAAALHNTNIKVNSAHPGWVKTDLGSDAAPMSQAQGAKTGVALATLPADGPTGKYIHMGKELPW